MTYSYDFSGMDANTIGNGSIMGAIMAFFAAYMIVILAIAIVMIIAQWKVFEKANKPGWAAIIPIYSNWVLFEAVGMKGWYALLALIPVVGGIIALVFNIMAMVKLATCFGKDGGFAVGLILLPVVFLPILGFGKAVFTAPTVTPNTPTM